MTKEPTEEPKQEAIVPQMAGRDIADMTTVAELEIGVHNVLKEYEDHRERAPGVRRLDDLWKEAIRVEDTNRHVLMMMNQGFILFQKAYDTFFAENKETEEKLWKLKVAAERAAFDGSPSLPEKTLAYTVAKAEWETRSALAQKNLRALMDSATKMAHEYRQCRTQAAYYFHITQLQQFFALIIAILHQNVHDATLLAKISKAISNASLKLFPQEVKQDAE